MPTPVPPQELKHETAPVSVRRFHYPLTSRPRDVALYSLVRDAVGTTRLRWDGVRPLHRIPAEHAATLRG